MATFDFAELTAADTATITIINPKTGDDIEGVTMELYGPESQFYKDSTSKLRSKVTEFVRRNAGMKPEQRQKEFDRLERIKNISLIKSINNFVFEGQEMKSPSDVCDKFDFVYKQACGEIENLANFIKG